MDRIVNTFWWVCQVAHAVVLGVLIYHLFTGAETTELILDLCGLIYIRIIQQGVEE